MVKSPGLEMLEMHGITSLMQPRQSRRCLSSDIFIRTEDLPVWEEARQRELEALYTAEAISFFQPLDEQRRSSAKVVTRTKYTEDGTIKRKTRVESTGDYVPVGIESLGPSVSAINVGALRAPTSGDDRYCMLDSGANVMVEGMVGDETMCSLVGDNILYRAAGLIVSRLYIGTKSYLVVAVQNAAVLLPPAYLVRIAGYRLSWANQSIRGRNLSPERWLWRISCSS